MKTFNKKVALIDPTDNSSCLYEIAYDSFYGFKKFKIIGTAKFTKGILVN